MLTINSLSFLLKLSIIEHVEYRALDELKTHHIFVSIALFLQFRHS